MLPISLSFFEEEPTDMSRLNGNLVVFVVSTGLYST